MRLGLPTASLLHGINVLTGASRPPGTPAEFGGPAAPHRTAHRHLRAFATNGADRQPVAARSDEAVADRPAKTGAVIVPLKR